MPLLPTLGASEAWYEILEKLAFMIILVIIRQRGIIQSSLLNVNPYHIVPETTKAAKNNNNTTGKYSFNIG